MSQRIDAHQHFWQLTQPFDYRWLDDPDLSKIRRDFLPSDLRPLISAEGVNRSVFVQTQHNVKETEWVLELAQEHDFIAGVVGWVDLGSPECEDQVVELKSHPKFVGVRHITQDEPDDDFIVRPDVLRGLRVLEKHGVPFDLLFYVKHLHHAATLARELPDLPMVVDHLAKPRIREQVTDTWLPQLLEAAKYPNVYCKLSGMVTEADWQNWQTKDLKPYVDQALEAFGPKRCMYGSDWPVCELAASYAEVHQALVDLTAAFSSTERELIFGGTATHFYGL
ncbi:MAG: amidohydrolase family protein [Pirellulaceae bacterium]